MHGTTIFLASLLAAGALAAPTTGATALSKRHFKVPVNGMRAKQAITPAREMEKIFAKYGWLEKGFSPFDVSTTPVGEGQALESALASIFAPVPTGASSATKFSPPPHFAASNSTTSAAGAQPTGGSSTGSGSSSEVTATPESNDSEYLVPVTIGGQTLNLDFDTGSADLWVFSTELPAGQSSGHTSFDPSKSSTWQADSGASWKISYGDGSSASGNVGFDTVAVGSATVTKQAVELATQVAQQFQRDTNSDGLLGLAFSSINTVTPTQQKTWFENVMSSLAQPLFSVDLGENDGSYEFGAIDNSAYTGQLHYVDVDNSDGFWQFPSTHYSVGGQTATNNNASPAIADTGTSLLLTDDAVVQAYYAQVSGAKLDNTQGGYTYPCSATLPDFGVAIGSYMVTLKGSGLTYASVDSNTCFGGIQSNAGAGYQIFGDVLLKQTYAVFDGGNTQFGIAQKN